MKLTAHRFAGAGLLVAAFAFAARADEHFDVLKVGGETYTNVTVTSVSATDIYFTSPGGIGNAKLKDLDPALQKHFAYNAAQAAAVEKSRATANMQFHQQLWKPAPAAPPETDAHVGTPAPKDDDFVAPVLYARSVRGQPAPKLEVETWLTGAPSTRGKFVLIDFWATWCGPCRNSIPELNGFANRYRSRLVVIGISDEPEAAIRKMTDPHIDYTVASDTQARMARELDIKGIPHCLLIDPAGIVRYEGMPTFLDDIKLEHFLDKYAQ